MSSLNVVNGSNINDTIGIVFLFGGSSKGPSFRGRLFVCRFDEYCEVIPTHPQRGFGRFAIGIHPENRNSFLERSRNRNVSEDMMKGSFVVRGRNRRRRGRYWWQGCSRSTSGGFSGGVRMKQMHLLMMRKFNVIRRLIKKSRFPTLRYATLSSYPLALGYHRPWSRSRLPIHVPTTKPSQAADGTHFPRAHVQCAVPGT
jgi:hypothetical protein